jgi:hypothetical protein
VHLLDVCSMSEGIINGLWRLERHYGVELVVGNRLDLPKLINEPYFHFRISVLLLIELFIACGEGVMQLFGLQQARFRGVRDVPRTPFLEPRQKLMDTH